MVIEATILCIDNSDWTRNGDYYPSRYRIQSEAVNFIVENRCESNPENSVGIMAMAGKRVEMISTLTNDESILLNSMKDIILNGECDITSTLNIALLCLKHRINKNQKQRIIIFVGSPVQANKESLVQIGKKLRKYNVAIDIISFGNVEENRESLNTLLTEVNNSNNSSMLEVPIGANIVDSLFGSAIMAMDAQEANPQAAGANPQGNQQPIGLSQFERDMNLALQMSFEEAQKNNNQSGTAKTNINANAEQSKALEIIEEDEELENAKLLSIEENKKKEEKEKKEKEKEAANQILESQDFLNDLLSQVNEQKKGDDKKEEDKKESKKEDKKDSKTDGAEKVDNKKEDKDKKDDKKGDDKMDIEK